MTASSLAIARPQVLPQVAERSASSLEALLVRMTDLDQEHSVLRLSEGTPVQAKPDKLIVGDHNLTLADHGWNRLAAFCSAPGAYWSQIAPEFRTEIANYHLKDRFGSQSQSPPSEWAAIAQGGHFLGFRKATLVHLSYADVLRAVMTALGAEASAFTTHRVATDVDSIQVELTTERHSEQVAVGDVVQGGIAISHSFLGSQPTTVDLFALRLRCTNGLSVRHCVGHVSISRSRRLKQTGEKSRTDALAQIQRMTHERMRHLSALLRNLGKLPEALVESASDRQATQAMRAFLMPSLRATHLWSDQLWDQMLLPAWQHPHGGNGELHEFAAINTITYVSTHRSELTFRQQRTLARLAGLLAFRRIHVCPRCHSAVVSP